MTAGEEHPTQVQAWARILRYCRQHNVQVLLDRMEHNAGEAYQSLDIVKLDPGQDVISTYIHELLHLAYEEMPEEEVQWLESAIMQRLSRRQFAFLLRRLAERTSKDTRAARGVVNSLEDSED